MSVARVQPVSRPSLLGGAFLILLANPTAAPAAPKCSGVPKAPHAGVEHKACKGSLFFDDDDSALLQHQVFRSGSMRSPGKRATAVDSAKRRARHPADAPAFLQVDPKAKEYKPWSVDDMKSPRDPMNEPSWVKDIGRGLTIGSLYDVRTDQPVPGFLFEKNTLDSKTRRVDTPYTALEMVSSDRLKDKFRLTNVETSLSMSIMVGFLELETGASAKYLEDKQQSSKTSRVSMNYMTRTHTEHLDLYDEELKHQMFYEPITNGLATHVVTGVLWGGNCYAIFEADSESVDQKQVTQIGLENMVKVNTPFIGFGSDLEMQTKISDNHTEISERTTVRIYGDHVPDGPIPTEVSAALEYVQRIPQTMAERPIPVAVQLFPLSKLDSKAAKLRQMVTDYSIDSAMDLFMELDDLEVLVKDLTIIKEDGFVLWKEQVRRYLGELQAYRASVVQQLGTVLKSVRDGTMPEDRLLDPVREHAGSDYSKERVESRVRVFADQIYNLKAWVKVLVQGGVHIAYSFSDFTSKTFDGDYDDVYVLIFKGMNPSADRHSSNLMRRFRSFAAKRQFSKKEAFVFVHYDSFSKQFGIEAAMSSMGSESTGDLPSTQLLQATAQPTSSAHLAARAASNDGSHHSDVAGKRPHAFPPCPGCVGSPGQAGLSEAVYKTIAGSEWLSGHTDDSESPSFFWHPSKGDFSWNPPHEVDSLWLQQRSVVASLLQQQRSEEMAAVKSHNFAEARRLQALQAQEEEALRTVRDIEQRVQLVSERRDYERASLLDMQAKRVRAALYKPSPSEAPTACSSQGLKLLDLGCQALLPPQCRARDFFHDDCPWSSTDQQSPTMKCTDGVECAPEVDGWGCCANHGGRARCPAGYHMCAKLEEDADYVCLESCTEHGGVRPCETATLKDALSAYDGAACRSLRHSMPPACFDVGISSSSCRHTLPEECISGTAGGEDAALNSTECSNALQAGNLRELPDSCQDSNCACNMQTSLGPGLCCDRRLRQTRHGSAVGSGWCKESPCMAGEFWCEDYDRYMAWHQRSIVPPNTSGSCVKDCTMCGGSRHVAVNSVCEQATPELCYNDAGGLLYCPPSEQCMADCAACAGYEADDELAHTCAKLPTPYICFEERQGMLFCPSSSSCVQASSCHTDCVGNPKRDYVQRQCSTGATLTSPLTTVGTPTSDAINVEFEAFVLRGHAFTSMMVLPRDYEEAVTPAMLWRMSYAMAEKSDCVVSAQATPTKPRKSSWRLRQCHLEPEVQYNLWMALSDDAVDATDALLSVVPVLVPQPVSFASQLTATLDATQGRLTIKFLVDVMEFPSSTPEMLLGWAWLLPSRLAACCLDTKNARLDPTSLSEALLLNDVEDSEQAVLHSLLACALRASPVDRGSPVVWTMDCPGPLREAARLNLALGVRVLVAEDGLKGSSGTLTQVAPVAPSPPCSPSQISVEHGRFGCAHMPSITDGSVCEVVPFEVPGTCTHAKLTCRGGQWMNCPDDVKDSPNASGKSGCVITTTVSCTAPVAADKQPAISRAHAGQNWLNALAGTQTLTDLVATLGRTQSLQDPTAADIAGITAAVLEAAAGIAGSAGSKAAASSIGQVAGAVPGVSQAVGVISNVVGNPGASSASNAVDGIAGVVGGLPNSSQAVGTIDKITDVAEALEAAARAASTTTAAPQSQALTQLLTSLSQQLVALESRQNEVSHHRGTVTSVSAPLSFLQLQSSSTPPPVRVEATVSTADAASAGDTGGTIAQDGVYFLVNYLSERAVFAERDGRMGASVRPLGTEHLWRLLPHSGGTTRLSHVVSGRNLCLGKYGNLADNVFALLPGEENSWSAEWKVTQDGQGVARFIGVPSGRALYASVGNDRYAGFGAWYSEHMAVGADQLWHVQPVCAAVFHGDLSPWGTRWAAPFLVGYHDSTALVTSGFNRQDASNVEVYGDDCAVEMYLPGEDEPATIFSKGTHDVKAFREAIAVKVVNDFEPTTSPTSTASTTTSTTTTTTEVPRTTSKVSTTTTATTTTTTTTKRSMVQEEQRFTLRLGAWSTCSQPCGDHGLRERELFCYKEDESASLEACGIVETASCQSQSILGEAAIHGAHEGRCEVEPCNRMDCVELDPRFDTSDEARMSYNKKRCRSSALHGRTALTIMSRQAEDAYTVHPLKCAEACRYTNGCVYFTVLRTEEMVANVPWCFGEATPMCDQDSGKGIMIDDAWNLYRLSSPANATGSTPVALTSGIITNTTVWHYHHSVLVDSNFVPPFVPEAPSAPAAVGRGASPGGEHWAKLSWDPPGETNGADVLYYQIRRHWWQVTYQSADSGEKQLYYRQASKISESRGPLTSSVLVSGLQPGRSYTFEVAAVNSEGSSMWSPLSATVRMGAAEARIEPKSTMWDGNEAVTLSLSVPAESPVARITVVANEDGRPAECKLVETKDPYAEFTCLAPAWALLGNLPHETGTSRRATLTAYDHAGYEIATAELKYADFTCPANAELKEVETLGADESDCDWFREHGLPKCQLCVCSNGYEKGPEWNRGQSSTEIAITTPSASSAVVSDSASLLQPARSRGPQEQEPDMEAPGIDEAPPRYTKQSTCEEIQNYCRAAEMPNGRLPDANSTGFTVHERVADLHEVCKPGYELHSTETGYVQDVVTCLPSTSLQGAFGHSGRPQEFSCSEVDRFCTKQVVPGGEIDHANVHESVDISCNSPARDAWPYNEETAASPRVTCVPNGESRVRGRFVTKANSDVAGVVQCAGCPRMAIQSDGDPGWIAAARIGQRGKMHCPAGWVLSDEFRGKEGPECIAEFGGRNDDLLGKWSFADWGGKTPRCIFADKCKDIDCGDHGECVIRDEEVLGGTESEVVTFTKKTAACMCTGGYHGDRCEQRPPMKCEYQIRYESHGARSQPITQSVRPQLLEASQQVVSSYKQLLDGDSEKEEQVVKALMTRTSKLNNVKVCCVDLDRSLEGKYQTTNIARQEFETSIDQVQITTSGTGIEDAMQRLMTEASIELMGKAREAARTEGLSEHKVSVTVRSISADIEMPVGLPPEGACMAVQ